MMLFAGGTLRRTTGDAERAPEDLHMRQWSAPRTITYP